MSEAARIFVSYKSEDRERVRLLVNVLEEAGFGVFWDKEIASGSEWRDFIAQQLRASDAVVVCWSKRTEDARAARWVLDELRLAESVAIPLFPVCVERCTIPLGYGQSQAGDLTDWAGEPDHPELEKLLKRLVQLGTGGVGAAADPEVAELKQRLRARLDQVDRDVAFDRLADRTGCSGVSNVLMLIGLGFGAVITVMVILGVGAAVLEYLGLRGS